MAGSSHVEDGRNGQRHRCQSQGCRRGAGGSFVEALFREFKPPPRIETPITSRILPMIEPVIDAFTTPVSPFESAISAMINSAALPKVAFNNPPTPWPKCSASSSVARPIQPAKGTIARHEQTNKATSFPRCGQKRSTKATGTKSRSQLSEGLNNDFKVGIGRKFANRALVPKGSFLSRMVKTNTSQGMILPTKRKEAAPWPNSFRSPSHPEGDESVNLAYVGPVPCRGSGLRQPSSPSPSVLTWHLRRARSVPSRKERRTCPFPNWNQWRNLASHRTCPLPRGRAYDGPAGLQSKHLDPWNDWRI